MSTTTGSCSHCGQKVEFDVEKSGAVKQCPKCGQPELLGKAGMEGILRSVGRGVEWACLVVILIIIFFGYGPLGR
jgi:NAD-dependent SIR2 family protein deacetylase